MVESRFGIERLELIVSAGAWEKECEECKCKGGGKLVNRIDVILFAILACGFLGALGEVGAQTMGAVGAEVEESSPSPSLDPPARRVMMFVLEGVRPQSITPHSMPVVNKLAETGSRATLATTVTPSHTVPAMATLLTGLPVQQHQATWTTYDFARSFLRSPTIFDFIDLAGGKDTAVFLMDERLYQLVRPEIYIDSQVCGYSKADCHPQRVVAYIRDYLAKVTSPGGHGFRLFAMPDLLLVHLPEAVRVGRKSGWESNAYRHALRTVDSAIGDVLDLYREYEVLQETMVIIVGLNGSGTPVFEKNGRVEISQGSEREKVPWIAWGASVRPGYVVTRSISIQDTSATVLRALGLTTHTEWNSHAINEIFQPRLVSAHYMPKP